MLSIMKLDMNPVDFATYYIHTQDYIHNTINLVKTLVIKNIHDIQQMNEYVKLHYGEDSVINVDIKEWKYYKNILGEYHFSDPDIKIISLDTFTEIPFTKDMLEIHRVTKANYHVNSKYYKELVSKYPEQELLIRSIVQPTDMDIDRIIEAEDGEILSYDKRYIDPQETTLMLDLSEFCKRYLSRWDVKAYTYIDSLYPSAMLAQLYDTLVLEILNLRLARCFTPEACDYHIRHFLASHYSLDKYIDYFNLKQKLYFYRNIRYIERRVGREDIQKVLIDILLTERRIPIHKYRFRQIDVVRDNDGFMDYQFQRQEINLPYNTYRKEDYTLLELLEKETRELDVGGIYGKEYAEQHLYKIDNKFIRTRDTTVQTKVMESDMVDYGDKSIYKQSDIVIHHWAYWSSSGRYQAYVLYEEPILKKQHTLKAEDAFILFMYLFYRSIGITLTEVPRWYSHRVFNTDIQLSDIYKEIKYDYRLKKTIEQEYNLMSYVDTVYSIPTFKDITQQLYDRAFEQWVLLGKTGNKARRGYLDHAFSRFYMDVYFDFSSTGEDMRTWLFNRNLDYVTYTDYDVVKAYKALLLQSTGYDIDSAYKLREIQLMMIECFIRLAAYSTQIVYDSKLENYIPAGIEDSRVDLADDVISHLQYIYTGLRFRDLNTYHHLTRSFTTDWDIIQDINTRFTDLLSKIDLNIDIKTDSISKWFSYIPIPYLLIKDIFNTGYTTQVVNTGGIDITISDTGYPIDSGNNTIVYPDIYT